MTNSSSKYRLFLAVIFLTALFSMGVDCGGGGTEPKDRPIITLISLSDTDIMPGENVMIGFTTLYADSVLLFPGGTSVEPFDTTILTVPVAEPGTIRLIAINSAGFDTLAVEVTMSGATASIDSIALSKTSIPLGDSTQLSWEVTNADSVVVDNGVGKLPSDSGTLWLKPSVTTTYRAIAHNHFNSSASVTVSVEIPESIQAQGGLYYKCEMGSSQSDPSMSFVLRSTVGSLIDWAWLHFEIVEGDGVLSDDSLLSNAATPTYDFSGSMGHAVVRVKGPGVDSLDIYLRANTLIPGPGGQGQYIRFDDYYAWVETFNGTPERIDPSETNLYYVVYEQSLGVVVMGIDVDANGMDYDDPLLGVIVNTVYDKTTPEGIGIGSTYQAFTTAYGMPDTTYLDPVPPAADVYIYDSLGITIFANPIDSVVFEMHLIDNTPAASVVRASGKARFGSPESTAVESRSYKLHPGR